MSSVWLHSWYFILWWLITVQITFVSAHAHFVVSITAYPQVYDGFHRFFGRSPNNPSISTSQGTGRCGFLNTNTWKRLLASRFIVALLSHTLDPVLHSRNEFVKLIAYPPKFSSSTALINPTGTMPACSAHNSSQGEQSKRNWKAAADAS